MTKVVVLEKFKKNWEIGSVVSVKDGYARNYLVPNGKAKFATKENILEIKSLEDSLLKKDDENKSNANKTAVKIIANVVMLSDQRSTRSIKTKLTKEKIANFKPLVL